MVYFITQQSSFVVPALCSLVPGVFYVRKPTDSLLADEGSAGLRSQGTHGRLSVKETVNAGQDSCVKISCTKEKICQKFCFISFRLICEERKNYPVQVGFNKIRNVQSKFYEVLFFLDNFLYCSLNTGTRSIPLKRKYAEQIILTSWFCPWQHDYSWWRRGTVQPFIRWSLVILL